MCHIYKMLWSLEMRSSGEKWSVICVLLTAAHHQQMAVFCSRIGTLRCSQPWTPASVLVYLCLCLRDSHRHRLSFSLKKELQGGINNSQVAQVPENIYQVFHAGFISLVDTRFCD